ncbi:MAG TPA: Maf family protein [Anaerolineales bacterium]|nr:Maf family protein [Anaerolineales bacterium]
MLESPDMVPQNQAVHQVYLASNSPRRKELLSLTGLEYTLLSAQVDETPLLDEDGIEYVRRIARSKAVTASHLPGVDGVIIAADTAVVDGFGRERIELLGKPKDPNTAVEMLQGLRGHTHQVLTAISILSTRGGTMRFDLCTTDVPMRNYSNDEIKAYVASGDPMDKAGAYAIQHAGFHPVDDLQGCFANVMGLPLCHLVRNLNKLDIDLPVDVPQACQAALKYDCPVFDVILKEKRLISP